MTVLEGWEQFEQSLIYQRYSIRDPHTNERLETTFENVVDRISDYLLSKEYPISLDIVESGLNLMKNRELIFATPALMNLGNPHSRRLGYYSCFPIGPIPDSTSEILAYVAACANVFQYAGGVGLDFSKLRAKGSPVDNAQGESSGPLGFISLFESTSKSIAAGGKRRGAMLGQLDYNHPDIMDFTTLKQVRRDLWSINISINAFGDFWKQEKLIREIAKGMWISGDPGLLFPDEIAMNSPYPEELKPLVRYVNPCAEYCSPPFSVCNLLTGNALKQESISDFEKLGYYLTTLGNVILWLTITNEGEGLPKTPKRFFKYFYERVKQLRPVGVGLTGVAEYLYKKKRSYNDITHLREVYNALARGSLSASHEWSLATKEEAAWDPQYKDRHLSLIGYESGETNHSFWNTTTLCQAPAGSVSQFLRCLSTGIEPLETFSVKRKFLNNDDKFEDVLLTSEVVNKDREIEEITITDQLDVISTIQTISHTSASKTINVPEETTQDEIFELIMKARNYRLKGLTVYRRGCALQSIVSSADSFNPSDKTIPDILRGDTYKFEGLNSIYITINKFMKNRPIEVFVSTGKSGNIVNGLSTGMGRIISLALKSGTTPEMIINSLKGIESGDFYVNKEVGRATSISDAIAKSLQHAIEVNSAVDSQSQFKGDFDLCPKCSKYTYIRQGAGCKLCLSCGFSTC